MQISASGTQVSGTGEVGARVSVRNAAGTLLGSGTVAADGTFSVALNTAQVNVQVLSVTLTDAANNVSVATSVTAPDLTPPAIAAGLAVSSSGLVLTGSGEVGATVTVKSHWRGAGHRHGRQQRQLQRQPQRRAAQGPGAERDAHRQRR
ncbi:Ig-like domain-containing protein [Pseudomonas sp. KNUC1026]|uniref:Ig-like domain-containing protein n=1 Tax=Pseudomonas sp. KNUC1026 TaxID=2893890 RepID=UPI001F445A27|nr:Ig-like domain-containing protein [Pseudomonas sp. KNUC1026]UFH51531.1 Ig-like domain-containing protein [Pseudomonas sp. KNUC1026]